MVATVVRAACPHDCPDTCALLVTVEDGRATAVRGDPDHPPTHGVLCTKVSRYTERVYHPDRLLHPLKRTGPKGSGRFERIGWDEALAEAARRLAAVAGPDGANAEAVLPYSYAGTMGLVQRESMAQRFFHRLGASRLDRTICSSAGGEALLATYGAKVGMHVERFAESRLILIWGSNPITSSVHFWTFAQAAKRAGATLWCIDPRRSETAEKCHRHVPLLPGTGRRPRARPDARARGARPARPRLHRAATSTPPGARCASGPWPGRSSARPPSAASPRTTCATSAHDYGTIRPAAIRLNYGMQRVRGGGNASRLIALLPCLVGAWREPAGGLLLSSSGWFRDVADDAALTRPDLLGARRPRTLNMSTIGDDLLRPASAAFGPRVDAIVVYNSNPVAVAPQSAKVAAGFARGDLYTVVLEQFMTDTARMADLVLPATTQLEHWDTHASYGHTWALVNRPAIAPLGEARPNSRIFAGLARAMGFDDPCFDDDDETLVRTAWKAGTGLLDLDLLHARGMAKLAIADAPFAEGGFATPDGRAVVDAPGLGIPDHVPNHESPTSTPELAVRYPLAMISPPARHFLNSTFANVASLRGIEGEPVLEISLADAAARRIADGDPVRVWNDRGEIRVRAVVGRRARPGVVNGLGIWWKQLAGDGKNVNELTHQKLADLGGAPCFYDCLVEVARSESAATAAA
jgi:anaerobic selenocysteine-containing dehydrogenase